MARRVAAVPEAIRDLDPRDVLERLSRGAEFREDETGEHPQRVGRTAGLLAEEMGEGPEMVELIRLAAPLHDLGKLGIPDRILLKPGGLDPSEQEVMRRHVVSGADLLTGTRAPVLELACQIALTHHERWDGTGYVLGLVGDAIPREGRITAVADVFDALIHDRPYRRAWQLDRAVEYVLGQAGGAFDPAVVEAFAKLDHAAMATSVEPTPAIMAARPEALHPPSTLSVTEAAHALAISVPTLRRWSDSGRIAVQRTAGGHRRYSIDEVRRVRAERTATSRPGLRPLPLPAAPIAPLADLLSERAGEVHEEAIRLMYRDNASGWFASVPARVASARWSGSLAAAAASGLYEPTRAATAALLQAAEVGGASLLERHSYVETFSERTTRALLATGIADRSELIAARRLFTSLRQQMLDDR